MSSPDEPDRVIQFGGAANAVLRPIVVVERARYCFFVACIIQIDGER
jgi:hypothetical protein